MRALATQSGMTGNVIGAMYHLLLVVFDSGESSIDCLDGTGPFAPVVMLVYMLISLVLLMNMLIALMAKTFEDSWAVQKEIYSFGFAQQEGLPAR